MSFLIDTNVLSELRKLTDGRANPNVEAWAASIDVSDLYVSVISLMEIEIGILRLERRDQSQAGRLRGWFATQVLPEFADRTLPIDTAVALRAASFHVPDPQPDRDTFIAATALIHGMTVVTRNVSDFVATGVDLLNPWESPTNHH